MHQYLPRTAVHSCSYRTRPLNGPLGTTKDGRGLLFYLHELCARSPDLINHAEYGFPQNFEPLTSNRTNDDCAVCRERKWACGFLPKSLTDKGILPTFVKSRVSPKIRL